MSHLIKSSVLPKFRLKNNVILVTAIRNHWNKDYKPGPFPKTEAERIAAAEKYGIPLSEYKPYPDDGNGAGTIQIYLWNRMHAEFDLMREDRYDVNAKLRRPMWFQWAQFFGAMFGSFSLYYLFEQIKMFPAVLPKQYPGDGRKHYTFEPKE
ncbi:hypothetical protein NQ314_013983 [Rhamnusium bicolor]|uniref:Uncharacterized protein n=1 Tax=Rhamnusium bicolor TaxID=1586634 RepID=A0AAV8X3Y6_9CUCU|nr:hypothetical protein NQ314_013983 [Rhamnusium bicolor]